jgi:hypothetical protein
MAAKKPKRCWSGLRRRCGMKRSDVVFKIVVLFFILSALADRFYTRSRIRGLEERVHKQELNQELLTDLTVALKNNVFKDINNQSEAIRQLTDAINSVINAERMLHGLKEKKNAKK